MQESLSSPDLSSTQRDHGTNSECATSGCANTAFHQWLSTLDDDAVSGHLLACWALTLPTTRANDRHPHPSQATVFANASADQVLELTTRASESAEPSSAVFVAVGACCALLYIPRGGRRAEALCGIAHDVRSLHPGQVRAAPARVG